MKSESQSNQLQFLAPSLLEMCNPKNPLWQLAEKVDWKEMESALSLLYADFGRPAKPIRLMVGLNLLKHMFNLGDETVIKAWVENPYYQYFTVESAYPSRCTGNPPWKKKLSWIPRSKRKNITYPTDVKLYSRVRKKYLYLQRFRKSKVRFKEAIRAEKKLKVIAARLTWELLKKLSKSRIGKYASPAGCLSADCLPEEIGFGLGV